MGMFHIEQKFVVDRDCKLGTVVEGDIGLH